MNLVGNKLNIIGCNVRVLKLLLGIKLIYDYIFEKYEIKKK